MAFDLNNPADLAALKSEINTDPLNIGYAAQTSTQQILNLLNDRVNNPGGETTGETLTPRLLLNVIDPGDLTVGGQFAQGDLEWLKLLIETTQFIDDDLSAFETKIRSLFPGNSTTITNLDAQIRSLSRAEVLFGNGTVISRADYLAARDS